MEAPQQIKTKNDSFAETDELLEQNFPSLELAYPLAIASYETMIKRLDAMDGRIQTLTTIAVTACLALPTLGKVQNLSLYSVWLVLGMTALVSAVGMGVYARLHGEIAVLDPNNLWNDSLHLPKAKFKSFAVEFAAEAFTANKRLLDEKWRWCVWTMFVFAIAILLLFLWLATAHPAPSAHLRRI